MSLNLKTLKSYKDDMDNKIKRELKVPISSEDIADMIDIMLADKSKRLSINDVLIYKIYWGNKRFTNP